MEGSPNRMVGTCRKNGNKAQRTFSKYNRTGKGDPRRPQKRWKVQLLI
jgi:hypothetical protein